MKTFFIKISLLLLLAVDLACGRITRRNVTTKRVTKKDGGESPSNKGNKEPKKKKCPKPRKATCPEINSSWETVCSNDKYDECSYDNMCLATAARFKEEDCEEFLIFDDCPTSDPSVVCILQYDPQICSNARFDSCFYTNMCFAYAAGFTEADCKRDQSDGCPAADETLSCPDGDSSPSVECSDDVFHGCLYDSLCVAEGAGFTKQDCVEQDMV